MDMGGWGVDILFCSRNLRCNNKILAILFAWCPVVPHTVPCKPSMSSAAVAAEAKCTLQYVLAIDPGVRNLGLAVVSGTGDDVHVLHLSHTDLVGPKAHDDASTSSGSGKRKSAGQDQQWGGEWQPARLKAALDDAMRSVASRARKAGRLTCVIERQNAGKSVGQLKLHEVVGACIQHVSTVGGGGMAGMAVVRMAPATRASYFRLGPGAGHGANKKAALALARMWLQNAWEDDRVRRDAWDAMTTSKKADDIADALLVALVHARASRLPLQPA
jgi:hypothetical protein